MEADFEKYHSDLNASAQLCNTLRDDFVDALNRGNERGHLPVDRRAAVRCFGSLLDGVTASMRSAAVMMCHIYDEPLNPFLEEKSAERDLSSHQRIYSIYRLLAGFLPKSPLAHVPDSRWEELRAAIDIRNRIIHPATLADIELSKEQTMLIMETGMNFFRDFTQFVQWFGQKEQRLWWDLPGTRRRYIDKIGRNEPCPCGSKRKFKNCCGPSQA